MIEVAGNVMYRERIRLSPEARIQVQLEDISRSDALAEVVAEADLDPAAGPPFPFRFELDPGVIDDRHRYALRARITVADQLRFTNTEYIDPFAGNPVEVLVQMVARPAAAASPDLESSRWGLESLYGEPVSGGAGGRQLDMEFSPEDQRVGGFAGCNRYSGAYSRGKANVNGPGLSFDEHMALTMMACPEGMELEQQYVKMLAKVTGFRIADDQLVLLQGATELARYRVL